MYFFEQCALKEITKKRRTLKAEELDRNEEIPILHRNLGSPICIGRVLDDSVLEEIDNDETELDPLLANAEVLPLEVNDNVPGIVITEEPSESFKRSTLLEKLQNSSRKKIHQKMGQQLTKSTADP